MTSPVMVAGEQTCALSVDLASGDNRNVGVVAISRTAVRIVIRPIDLGGEGLIGRPAAVALARCLVDLAGRLGTTCIGLDGPQAWKFSENGFEHSRECERKLHTQGKTGLPGSTKPRNYLGFTSFCIETFDALAERGWSRLASADPPRSATAVETFPTAAWRALGLTPLPGKRKAKPRDLELWIATLMGLGPIEVTASLSHDQLQAAVAGLGVLALAEGRVDGFEAVGRPPFVAEGHWLEGFIVNPRRDPMVGMRA